MLAFASIRPRPFANSTNVNFKAFRVRQVVIASVIPGKTVVVTGASQGIGLEFASQLLQKGNTVVAAVRNPASNTGLQQLQQSVISTVDGELKELHRRGAATLGMADTCCSTAPSAACIRPMYTLRTGGHSQPDLNETAYSRTLDLHGLSMWSIF